MKKVELTFSIFYFAPQRDFPTSAGAGLLAVSMIFAIAPENGVKS